MRHVAYVANFLEERVLLFQEYGVHIGFTHNSNFLVLMEYIWEFEPFLSKHIGLYECCEQI